MYICGKKERWCAVAYTLPYIRITVRQRYRPRYKLINAVSILTSRGIRRPTHYLPVRHELLFKELSNRKLSPAPTVLGRVALGHAASASVNTFARSSHSCWAVCCSTEALAGCIVNIALDSIMLICLQRPKLSSAGKGKNFINIRINPCQIASSNHQ